VEGPKDTGDDGRRGGPKEEAEVADPQPFLLAARTHSTSGSPAELVLAGLAIVSWYRWWLWYAVGKLDPLAISEDNILTRTRRVEIRARSIDSTSSDRLVELGLAAHKLRNKLVHVDPRAPSGAQVTTLIDGANEFAELVEAVVRAHALPQDPADQASYIDATLYRIYTTQESLRGHYPENVVDGIMDQRDALEGAAKAWTSPEIAQPLMILLREYERTVDRLASAMYSTCPKCGGQMAERSWEEQHGATESDPAPQEVGVWMAISCTGCGHTVMREIVAEYNP
jgi:hypothetical protein